jgi:hypothetical protein
MRVKKANPIILKDNKNDVRWDVIMPRLKASNKEHGPESNFGESVQFFLCPNDSRGVPDDYNAI